MISDPNVFFLGTEAYNDEALLVFADGQLDLHDDPDDIDPSRDGDFDWRWSFDAGGGDWELVNESRGDPFITARLSASPDIQLQVHERTKFMAGVRDLTHYGESVAFTDFTNLSLEDDDGEFARFERLGASDYELYLHEGATEERVFTTSDDGTFDAATLEGRPLSAVAERDQDETITGDWAFTGFITDNLSINADISAETADVVSVDTVDLTADNGTVGGSEIITEAHEYYPVASDDTATVADVGEFYFGDDLAITETADGIQVDNIMATIPSNVYDDGTLILEDANGLDFVDPHISAIDQGNGIAEIGVSLPSTLLHEDVDETIAGTWTFEQHVTGSIDHSDTSDHATQADSATNADSATTADTASDADNLEGAPRSTFTEHASSESISGNWTFDTGPDIDASEELSFQGTDTSMELYYSESTGRLNVEYTEGGTSNRIAAYDYDRGLISSTGGNRSSLELDMGPGNVFVTGHADDTDVNWSRTVGISSGATTTPGHQFNASGSGAMLGGPVEVNGDLTVNGDTYTGADTIYARYVQVPSVNNSMYFRDSGGSAQFRLNSGQITLGAGGADTSVENELTVGGDIQLPSAAGSSDGIQLDNGVSFSQYDGYGTVYFNSQVGGKGFRVFDSDGSDYVLRVTETGATVGGHLDSDTGAFSSSLTLGGDYVATQNWTSSNFNNYSDSDARDAVTSSDLSGSVTASGTITSGGRLIAENASGSSNGVQVGDLADNHLSTHDDRVTQYSGEANGWGWRTGSDVGGYNWSMQLDHNGPLRVNGDTVVVGDSTYEIQKNGSDASGVINFKTS